MIIKTTKKINKCSCGETVLVKTYMEIEEGLSYYGLTEKFAKSKEEFNINKVRFGICPKCQNVFIK